MLPLPVAAQQTEHGVDKGLGRVVLGEALDVALHHRDAVLDSVAVAVDGVHPEDHPQGCCRSW